MKIAAGLPDIGLAGVLTRRLSHLGNEMHFADQSRQQIQRVGVGKLHRGNRHIFWKMLPRSIPEWHQRCINHRKQYAVLRSFREPQMPPVREGTQVGGLAVEQRCFGKLGFEVGSNRPKMGRIDNQQAAAFDKPRRGP